MMSKMAMAMGAIAAIALIVGGLWGWSEAAALARLAEHPEAARWAVRCAAIAAWSGAQVLGLNFIVGAWYAQDQSGEWMRLGAGFVCTAALVVSLALGFVCR